MIDINLVPVSLRKKSSSGALSGVNFGIPQEILLGVGGGIVAFMVLVHVLLFVALAVNGIIFGVHKMEWQRMLPEKNTIDALGTQLKDLKGKMNSITQVTSPKAMGWSRKLNTISDAVPRGLWLRKVVVDSTALVIEGSVVSKTQNEIVIVGNFVSDLKKDEAFMADLAGLEVNSIVRVKRGATDVANFTITAKLK